MSGDKFKRNQERTDDSVEQAKHGSGLRTGYILPTTEKYSDQEALAIVKKGGKLTEPREIMSAIRGLSSQILGGKKEVSETNVNGPVHDGIEETDTLTSKRLEHMLSTPSTSSMDLASTKWSVGSVSSQSSDTLVSLDEIQTDKQLDNTTQEDREVEKQKVIEWLKNANTGPELTKEAIEKQGKELDLAMRKMVPHSTTMYASELAREIIGKHKDWLKKLQDEGGIKVNERTLRLIGQLILEKGSPRALDYHRAISNFNETLDKFKSKDLATLRLEPVGLRGGEGVYTVRSWNGQVFTRFMTLTNPFTGEEKGVCKGEQNSEIAQFINEQVETHVQPTINAIEQHKYNPFHAQWIAQQTQWVEWIRYYYKVTANQVEEHVNRPEWITSLGQGGDEPRRGKIGIGHWSCDVTYHHQNVRHFYLNDGTTFDVTNLDYEFVTPEEHEAYCAGIEHRTVGGPEPVNCLGDVLLSKHLSGWLTDTASGTTDSAMRKILHTNNYQRIINDQDAIYGDLIIYEKNGKITHGAKIVSYSDGSGRIWVSSKMGRYYRIHHPIDDQRIGEIYGTRTIYRHRTRPKMPFFYNA